MQGQQLPGAYYLTDLLLFFCLFAACMVVFGVFHFIALRMHDPKRLLLFLSNVYLVSAAFVTAVSYFLLSDQFSSFGCYLIAIAGTVLAGFFASGLYVFLGPSTADRSLTAHLLIFLHRSPGNERTRNDVFEICNAGHFIEKRLLECSRAGIIRMTDDKVSLTRKGTRLAAIYDASLHALKLSSRKQYRFSFPDPAD